MEPINEYNNSRAVMIGIVMCFFILMCYYLAVDGNIFRENNIVEENSNKVIVRYEGDSNKYVSSGDIIKDMYEMNSSFETIYQEEAQSLGEIQDEIYAADGQIIDLSDDIRVIELYNKITDLKEYMDGFVTEDFESLDEPLYEESFKNLYDKVELTQVYIYNIIYTNNRKQFMSYTTDYLEALSKMKNYEIWYVNNTPRIVKNER